MVDVTTITRRLMGTIIETDHYSIYINAKGSLQGYINRLSPSKIIVLVDENTEEHCLYKLYADLADPFEIISIPSGENHKNLSTCELIWHQMLKLGADRKSVLLALGGGVVGDMGGFVASTYMRGIPFVHLPTTLLSMVDSSIGGKLGVDFYGYKNMIGLFNTPLAVCIDTDTLDTLPYRQLVSGYAEMLKHGLIQDKDYWTELAQLTDLTSDLESLIVRSIEIKDNIVKQDLHEGGPRKMLNFGHTIGHAVESVALHTENPLLHGEAISVGIVCESYLSYCKGYITLPEVNQIKEVIKTNFGSKNKSLTRIEDLQTYMLKDKKNVDGKILFSLLEEIGQGNINQEVSQQEISDSLAYYTAE